MNVLYLGQRKSASENVFRGRRNTFCTTNITQIKHGQKIIFGINYQ